MIASNQNAFSFSESYEFVATSMGWTLIHFLWQGLLIAAATALLLKLLRRCSANVHYIVACGGLCLMALAPVLTFASINRTQENLLPNPPAVAVNDSLSSASKLSDQQASVQKSVAPIANPEFAADFERFRLAPAESENSWIQTMYVQVRGTLGWLAPWIAGIWVVGVLLAATRLFFGWKTLSLLRSEAMIGQHPQLTECLLSLKRQIGVVGEVTLGLSQSVVNPLVTGWLRPLILLPAKVAEELSPVQIKAVLAHELAHVRRGDFAINVLQCIIETLLFFHPCVWWASAKVRHERENCCDDLAVKTLGSRKSYAEALLFLEQTRTRNERLAMGASGGSLVQRIRRLTRPRNKSSFRHGTRVAPAVLGLCVLLPLLPGLVAIATAAMQEQETEKDPMILNQEIAITIVDAEGKPVPKINIHAGVWSGDGTIEGTVFPPNRNYTTDKDGHATVELPHNYYIVRLWFSGDGFVPMYTSWEERQIVDGDTPPKTLNFTVYRGISGGGMIVDSDGNPVANAKVSLSGGGVELKGPIRFLGDYGTVETDEKGKWTFKNLNPDPGSTFKVKVEHEEYLAKESALDRKSLLAGTPKVSLSQGIQVTGKITDVDGNVVDNGLVIWGDMPYMERGSQEVEIDDKGNFQTLPLIPAKRKRITVVAKGYAPESKHIDIADGMPPVNFKLEHGHKLRVKVTDSDDVPIAGAYLTLRRWRGARSLYSHRHPNVKPTGIPIQANDDGVFEWDWAPADAVLWSVGARGYLQGDEVSLAARDEVHVVKLVKKPTVTGSIRFADTGKPGRFTKVTPIIKRPNSAGSVSRRDSDAVVANAKGEFALEITRSGYDYRLEFSKKGYRSFLSEPFDALTPPENLVVELEKSSPAIGTVVNADGQPVESADIYLVDENNPLRLNQYKARRVPNTGTNEKGEFEIEKQFDPTTLVIMHPQGYAEFRMPATGEDDPKAVGPRVELKPWAIVKGKVMVNGEPVSNASIKFEPQLQGPYVFNQIHSSCRTKSRSNGEFQFSKIGSQEGSISVFKRSANGQKTLQRIRIPFKATPGEVSKLNIDFNYLIEGSLGEVEFPKHADFEQAYCSFTKIDDWESKLPSEVAESNPHAGDFLKTLKHLEAKKDFKNSVSLSNSLESINGSLNEDGTIRGYLSGPGTYQLTIHLNGRPQVESADVSVSPLVRHQSIVEVREGNHQLPELDIPFEEPVAMGDSVAEVEFQSGEEKLSFSDFKGKVVLVDFWCDWSTQISASNNAIAGLKSAVQVNDPLAILSIQCGSANEGKVKRQFADELKPYVQSVLMDYEASAELCPKFNAWNVPLAVVIDRDGKLRFTGSHKDAVEMVHELLEAE